MDLLSGANAHLTRSVLDAGGLGDLADVAQRRLQLSAHSFVKPLVFLCLPFLALAVALGRAATRSRRGLAAGPARHARRACSGRRRRSCSAPWRTTPAGIVLVIGSAFLLVFGGYAWAEAGSPGGRYS